MLKYRSYTRDKIWTEKQRSRVNIRWCRDRTRFKIRASQIEGWVNSFQSELLIENNHIFHKYDDSLIMDIVKVFEPDISSIYKTHMSLYTSDNNRILGNRTNINCIRAIEIMFNFMSDDEKLYLTWWYNRTNNHRYYGVNNV